MLKQKLSEIWALIRQLEQDLEQARIANQQLQAELKKALEHKVDL